MPETALGIVKDDELTNHPLLQVPWSRLLASFKHQQPKSPTARPPLVLIRGLPGSGKSTLASGFKGYLHRETDQFFVGEQGNYHFDKEKLRQAPLWCQQEALTALQAGTKVVVSNTFTQPFELHPYLVMASWLGIPLQIQEAKGQWQNSHQVPEEALQAMRKRWYPLEPGHYTPFYCPLAGQAGESPRN